MRMDLRFQEPDEVEKEVEKSGKTRVWKIVAIISFCAVVFGLGAWLDGESLKSYREELTWLMAFGFVYWLASPIYQEFRIRTKEINGQVSAIEDAVNPLKERIAQLDRKMDCIIEQLGCSTINDEDWRDFSNDPAENSPTRLALTRERAEQGFPRAQYRLGLHYAFGVQVEKDQAKAANWFRKAAKGGHAYAQLHLGMACFNADGVPPDIEEGFCWVYLSARSCSEAREWLNRIGEQLTAARRAELETLCREKPWQVLYGTNK